MTILPKKKQPKDKNDAENVDRQPHSPSAGGTGEGRVTARHSGMPGSPGSGPPRWGSPPPLEHDRGPVHESGACRYEETGGATAGSLGSLCTNKRRLRDRDRSPPSHRNSRKQRHDGRGGGVVPYSRHSGLRPSGASSSAECRPGSSQMGLHAGSSSTSEELNSGYNSEDECISRPRDANAEEVCVFVMYVFIIQK